MKSGSLRCGLWKSRPLGATINLTESSPSVFSILKKKPALIDIETLQSSN